MYISRNSVNDAKYLFEKFVPSFLNRKILIEFLADKIIYASKINNANWNLNLDKNGNFIRFNTGHEYCIQITKEKILILCLKKELKNFITKEKPDIIFQGYSNSSKIKSQNLDDTPDCLAKVPDSVGCLVKFENFKKYISILDHANKSFIKYAINHTKILPNMKYAHSFGAIKYVEIIAKKNIPNPLYTLSHEEFERYKNKIQKETKKLSLDELKSKALEKRKILKKVNVQSTQYLRDPFVSEYVKKVANGICQDCKQPAPFISKKTGEPYLETHHIKPLSQGGSDTIDNVIALCPNCHRKRHYG